MRWRGQERSQEFIHTLVHGAIWRLGKNPTIRALRLDSAEAVPMRMLAREAPSMWQSSFPLDDDIPMFQGVAVSREQGWMDRGEECVLLILNVGV